MEFSVNLDPKLFNCSKVLVCPLLCLHVLVCHLLSWPLPPFQKVWLVFSLFGSVALIWHHFLFCHWTKHPPKWATHATLRVTSWIHKIILKPCLTERYVIRFWFLEEKICPPSRPVPRKVPILAVIPLSSLFRDPWGYSLILHFSHSHAAVESLGVSSVRKSLPSTKAALLHNWLCFVQSGLPLWLLFTVKLIFYLMYL